MSQYDLRGCSLHLRIFTWSVNQLFNGWKLSGGSYSAQAIQLVLPSMKGYKI